MATSQLPQHIFRAYDIRGHADRELTDANVYRIGYAFGAWLKQHQVQSVNLGQDGRLSSPRIAAALGLGLLASGCEIINLGQCHTGLLYFSTYQQNAIEALSDSAVMVTASHNPKPDNGFKMVLRRQPLSEQQIQQIYQQALGVNPPVPKTVSAPTPERKPIGLDSLLATPIGQKLQQLYVQRLQHDVSLARRLKVVIDAGNGSAGPLAESVFGAFNIELIHLFCDVDGNFPNHHPDPSEADNLVDLSHAVRQHKADLGLAFDGDGDRVVAVDHRGQALSSDHLLMLLIQDIVPQYPGSTVVADVKSCRHIKALVEDLNGQYVIWQTGHSKMKQKMAASQAIVGGEFSGHFYIADHWYGFDDGIYVGLRLVQQIAGQPYPLAHLVKQLATDIATPEIQLTTTEQAKYRIIEALGADSDLLAGARVTTIDGIRLDYAEGWGLVRASNTSAKLTLRVAAKQRQKAQMIWQKLLTAVTKVAPELLPQMEKADPFSQF